MKSSRWCLTDKGGSAPDCFEKKTTFKQISMATQVVLILLTRAPLTCRPKSALGVSLSPL